MCYCTPNIRTPFCPSCNQTMFDRIKSLTKQHDELQAELAALKAQGEPVYQLSLDQSKSPFPWIDVSEIEYTDAGMFPEYRRRMLYTAPQPAVRELPDKSCCCCSPEFNLSAYAGGGSPDGLYGSLTMLVNGVFIRYVKQQPAQGEPVGKIDYDEQMDRYYIPVHPDWEVQTKGKGSSFRLANTKTGERCLIDGGFGGAHSMLERMARDINAAMQAPQPSGKEE